MHNYFFISKIIEYKCLRIFNKKTLFLFNYSIIQKIKENNLLIRNIYIVCTYIFIYIYYIHIHMYIYIYTHMNIICITLAVL